MNTRFGQRLELFLVIIIIVYFIFLIGHDCIQYLSFMKKSRDLKLSLTEQENIYQQLQDELHKFQTNDYLEYLARQCLGYVKIGETAYKITP